MSMPSASSPLPSLLAEYGTRLTAALEMLTAEAVEITEIPAEDGLSLILDSLHKEFGNWVWSRYEIEGNPSTCVWTGASELTSKAIGAKVLLAAGIEEIADNDVSDSYSEVQQSAVAALAQWLSRQVGQDISCTLAPAETGPPVAEDCFLFRVKVDNQRLDPICLAVPASLRALLKNDSTAIAEVVEPTRTPSAHEGSKHRDPAPMPDRAFDRVLDFELPLRVSFGKAHLPLRDVLKLTTGSIVELDRSISDPVEIVVNNRVIGRGEVVVIEGNYGIRIQEIVTHSG